MWVSSCLVSDNTTTWPTQEFLAWMSSETTDDLIEYKHYSSCTCAYACVCVFPCKWYHYGSPVGQCCTKQGYILGSVRAWLGTSQQGSCSVYTTRRDTCHSKERRTIPTSSHPGNGRWKGCINSVVTSKDKKSSSSIQSKDIWFRFPTIQLHTKQGLPQWQHSSVRTGSHESHRFWEFWERPAAGLSRNSHNLFP